MLREKIFKESMINIIEANLLITIIVSVDDPIMNLLNTPQSDLSPIRVLLRYYILVVMVFANINLPINPKLYVLELKVAIIRCKNPLRQVNWKD
jgi:hypothetical protein